MEEYMWKGVDGKAPELIIVYYSAGADVNIHTTGRFPFACAYTSAQLMESVEVVLHVFSFFFTVIKP